jgi:hypothetical protein
MGLVEGSKLRLTDCTMASALLDAGLDVAAKIHLNDRNDSGRGDYRSEFPGSQGRVTVS